MARKNSVHESFDIPNLCSVSRCYDVGMGFVVKWGMVEGHRWKGNYEICMNPDHARLVFNNKKRELMIMAAERALHGE